MSLLQRRLATLGPFAPTPTLALRDSGAGTGTEEDASNATIAPFSTALNGVNQPMNMLFKDMLYWTLGIMGLIVLSIRLGEIVWSKLRQVSAMSAPPERQGYWRKSQWGWMPSLKKHLIYAPLWRKRHNREIQLSKAISIGTLPSRLHFVILALYLISNLVYTLIVDWDQENHFALAAEIRGRSGTLAAINMVPLIILAGRNNPLIAMLKVSFDTYNLLHRWLGRIVVIEAVIHTAAWMYVDVAAHGWDRVSHKLIHESFVASGFVGTVCLAIILFLSVSPLRHAFYETFLNVHIILAFVVFAMTWVHCVTAHVGILPQLPMIMAIFVLWFTDRLARMFQLAYNNWSSKGFTEAVIEPMPGDSCRVTMYLPRHVEIEPGTHAYLRFMGINPWECHPFSVAWVEHMPDADKNAVMEKNYTVADIKRGTTACSFIIGAHSGFTRKLYNKASAGGAQSIRVRAAMEGPYAGHHSLDSYGHVVLFAGATGITHQISHLKPLIEGFNDGTVATRRITLVWIMRDTEALQWVRPWMDEILRMPNRRDILNVRLFITRPKNAKEIHSPSSTVQMFPGRPNVSTLLKKEVEEQIGAMCVTVCGPGALADDVRAAVRECQDFGTVIHFEEESFTWESTPTSTSVISAASSTLLRFATRSRAPSRQYGGSLVVCAFSGSHQDAIKKGFKAREEQGKAYEDEWEIPYLPLDPQDIGRTYEGVIRVNSQSGNGGTVWIILRKLELDLPRGIVAIDGKEYKLRGRGNGPISSLADALKGVGIELDAADYKEHAMGGGREVKTATYIECTAAGTSQKVWGVGIHEDVVQSSLMALLGAASNLSMTSRPGSPIRAKQLPQRSLSHELDLNGQLRPATVANGSVTSHAGLSDLVQELEEKVNGV
ncbi:hypothetical protein DL770_006941 [Monosporascus sp. CRB-9-2]|nr:hypothetical protein DL770_006941 [Monosporascus sp. CRB-9-2]